MQGIAFGPTIRLLRQAKGISLRELARQLGVSPAFLSQIEAGRQHKIPKARIVQVADMLGVSEAYLLGTARQVHPDLLRFLSETPEASEFSSKKAEEFGDRFVTILNNGALCLMVSIGHRTGLFDVTSKMPPPRPQQRSRSLVV